MLLNNLVIFCFGVLTGYMVGIWHNTKKTHDQIDEKIKALMNSVTPETSEARRYNLGGAVEALQEIKELV